MTKFFKLMGFALMLFASPALAQQPALVQQPDPTLAGVQQDWQGLDIARSHLAESLNKLIAGYQTAAKAAAYWEDACKSTPECGGPAK